MGLLQDSILLAPDVLANIPAAGSVPIGAIYCVTNSSPANQLFRNNGATWDPYSPTGGGGATSVTAAGTLTFGQPVLGAGSKAVAVGPIDLAGGASFVTGDLPLANLAQGSALSVLGVTGNATADNASIAAGSDHQVLRRSGTAVAFGAVNLAQSAAVTGVLPVANGGTGVADGAAIRTVTKDLTNAEIIALPTAAITVVAAPGAGFFNRLIAASVKVVKVAGYTGLNATFCTLELAYGVSGVDATNALYDDSGSGFTSLTDFLTGVGTRLWLPGPTGYMDYDVSGGLNNYSLALADAENRTLHLTCGNGGVNLGGGNAGNSMRVIMQYVVEPI